MRLFIGIHLSKMQSQTIARAQADLKRQGVTGRFTPSSHLHLTLAFLGECDANQVDAVQRVLKKMRFAPFHLKLKTDGRFGDLVWVAPAPQPALDDLASRLRAALKRIGIAFDEKAFKPHITILRKARSTNAFTVHLDPADGVVSRIALIQSERGAAGRALHRLIHGGWPRALTQKQAADAGKADDPRQQIFKPCASASSGENRRGLRPTRMGRCRRTHRRYGEDPHL